MNQIKYFYTTLGTTSGKLSFGGTSHPPFFLLFGFIFYKFSQYTLPFLNVPLSWGIIVTLINILLIPLTALIAKEICSEKIGKLTGLAILVLPSFLMHTCALLEGIPTIFVALGILILLRAYKIFSNQHLHSSLSILKYSLAIGLCFTIGAQFTYGHTIPIMASLCAFFIIVNKKSLKAIVVFMLGLFIAPLMYFIFEFIISSGTSFYIFRAFSASNQVADILDTFRPYPMSQLSNLIVMSVMGGILWIPIIIFSLWNTICNFKCWILRKKSPMYDPVLFMTLSISIMFFILCIQKTTRLEVERTWFWFFFPIWSLIGVYLNKIQKQLYSKSRFGRNISHFIWIILLQILNTIFVLTQVQDYY